LLRASLRPELDLAVVAVNDLAPPTALAKLLERDSVFGRFDHPVRVEGNGMFVGDQHVTMLSEPEVRELPWTALGIDVVVESTGRFTAGETADAHLGAGAPRVVISAPARDVDATFVLGVNDDTFDPDRHIVVSNASCTTNCLAILAKVLDDAFGIDEGLVSTVHAYTGDQRLVDSVHKDPRRARAAGINIIPTSTGAARTTGEVLPHLAGRLDAVALRVPVPDGSLTDLVATVRGRPDGEQVAAAYRAAAEGALAGRLEFSEEALVSTDIIGSSASCVFDAGLTMIHGSLVKVFGWYDNEWGYANRLAELTAMVGAAPRPPVR
jgi:glyceraldehyde 3-phosphate dehydrogenase